MPSNLSAIFVSDFKTPQDLAKFITMLNNNDELYMQYFSHKGPNGIIADHFVKLCNTPDPWCELCKKVEKFSKEFTNTQLKSEALLPDDSCRGNIYKMYE